MPPFKRLRQGVSGGGSYVHRRFVRYRRSGARGIPGFFRLGRKLRRKLRGLTQLARGERQWIDCSNLETAFANGVTIGVAGSIAIVDYPIEGDDYNARHGRSIIRDNITIRQFIRSESSADQPVYYKFMLIGDRYGSTPATAPAISDIFASALGNETQHLRLINMAKAGRFKILKSWGGKCSPPDRYWSGAIPGTTSVYHKNQVSRCHVINYRFKRGWRVQRSDATTADAPYGKMVYLVCLVSAPTTDCQIVSYGEFRLRFFDP